MGRTYKECATFILKTSNLRKKCGPETIELISHAFDPMLSSHRFFSLPKTCLLDQDTRKNLQSIGVSVGEALDEKVVDVINQKQVFKHFSPSTPLSIVFGKNTTLIIAAPDLDGKTRDENGSCVDKGFFMGRWECSGTKPYKNAKEVQDVLNDPKHPLKVIPGIKMR